MTVSVRVVTNARKNEVFGRENGFKVYLLSLRKIMDTLAEAILERDKETRSVACPMRHVSDERRSRSPKAASPFGEGASLACCFVAPPRSSAETTSSSSRLASGSNLRLPIYPLFCEGSVMPRLLKVRRIRH